MARPRVTDERKEQILEAFEACVVRQGIERTTLDDIAREAGQPRSLVRYFTGNRDELVVLLVNRLLMRTAERIRSMRARSGGDAVQLISLYFDEMFADEHSNRIVIELWRLATLSDGMRARVLALYDELLHDLAEDLAQSGIPGTPQEIFDGAYAAFAVGLGSAILKTIGVSPVNPKALSGLAQSLALGRVRQSKAVLQQES